jgi:tetratricopeptide (TPR) repeat protein
MRVSLIIALLAWLCCSCNPEVETSDHLPLDAKMDAEKSLEYLSKVINYDSDNEEARYQRAVLYFQKDDLLKAKTDIVEALADKPNEPEYLYLKAKIDDHLGQPQEVKSTIEKIQKADKQFYSLDYLLFASSFFMKTGNLSKSSYFLQLASESVPDHPLVYCQRALYYSFVHDTAKAFQFYRKSIERDSTVELAYLNMADLFDKTDKSDSSLQMLSKVKSTKNVQYHILLAKALMHTHRMDSAAEHLQVALNLAPKLPAVNFQLGCYYLAKGEMDKAEQRFACIAENDRGKFRDFNYRYAVALEGVGNTELAKDYYNKQYYTDSTVFNKKKK